jgi:two-component system sensor histidine kinase UhpB
MDERRRGSDRMGLSLFWRVCLINATVFAVGVLVLVASPATVSWPIVTSEALVLLVWLITITVANAALLRTVLSPLDRLRHLMDDVDLLRPGQRLPETGNGAVADLIHTFNAMLDRLEAERATSTQRALAAQEGERRRVAQELHDEVGQSLTAVLLGLRSVADRAPADLRGQVGVVQEAARSSLHEIRHVVRRLRPGVLDDLGLCSALASLASEHARLTGAEVCHRLDAPTSTLDAQSELVVYRVAQEALTNVARHAEARRVSIELTGSPDSGAVLLRVEDDGRGMSGAPEGAGLRGMRERALLVGAALDVCTREAGGTEVRLLVPTRTQEDRS